MASQRWDDLAQFFRTVVTYGAVPRGRIGRGRGEADRYVSFEGAPGLARTITGLLIPNGSPAAPAAGALDRLAGIEQRVDDLRQEIAGQHDAVRCELAALREAIAGVQRDMPAAQQVAAVVRTALRDQETVMYHTLDALAREVMVVRDMLEERRLPWWRRLRRLDGGAAPFSR